LDERVTVYADACLCASVSWFVIFPAYQNCYKIVHFVEQIISQPDALVCYKHPHIPVAFSHSKLGRGKMADPATAICHHTKQMQVHRLALSTNSS